VVEKVELIWLVLAAVVALVAVVLDGQVQAMLEELEIRQAQAQVKEVMAVLDGEV
jgi:hypothetical protein